MISERVCMILIISGLFLAGIGFMNFRLHAPGPAPSPTLINIARALSGCVVCFWIGAVVLIWRLFK